MAWILFVPALSRKGVMKVGVYITFSVRKQELSVCVEHVEIWKVVCVETFEELSVHIRAWRYQSIFLDNSS